jgi:hypothetical protein
MFPPENTYSTQEEEIIFRIRQLIGDEKEVFVDDTNTAYSPNIKANGTIYQLEEPKGYPLEIYVNGTEYSGTNNPVILSYKMLQFNTPILVSGANLTVIYEHFRHSDDEIINTYDTSATTYLVAQCNLTMEDYGIDLLVLATAYILLMKDLSNYIKSAISLQDSDSQVDTSGRPTVLRDLLKAIADELLLALKAKTSCKLLSLPVYKVE